MKKNNSRVKKRNETKKFEERNETKRKKITGFEEETKRNKEI
jgi:hypothetical protein